LILYQFFKQIIVQFTSLGRSPTINLHLLMLYDFGELVFPHLEMLKYFPQLSAVDSEGCQLYRYTGLTKFNLILNPHHILPIDHEYHTQ
jgi:hypothetical protein